MFSAVLALGACQKKMINFGSDFVNNGATNVILVDTLTPVVSTVLLDSIITSGTTNIIVGNTRDPLLGTTRARSFFKIQAPYVTDLSTSATYDSLTLILKKNRDYYGDTTGMQQITVYPLAVRPVFAENQVAYYDHDSIPIVNTPLGTLNTLVYPNFIYDTLAVKLSDSKGQELFDLYKKKDPKMTDANQFADYFKGLSISMSSPGTGQVVGFKDSAIMRLYYHEDNIVRQNKQLDFTLADESMQFNNIKHDLSGTALASLKTTPPARKEIVSDSTNHMGFWQPAGRVVTKVTFPSLRSLLQLPDYLKILKASLTIQPVQGTYRAYPLPDQLEMAHTNQANEIGATLVTVGATGQMTVQTGNLQVDYILGKNTTYTYDVTSYLQAAINNDQTNADGLMLIPNNTYSSVLRRLVIGDRHHTTNPIQLKVFYISLRQ